MRFVGFLVALALAGCATVPSHLVTGRHPSFPSAGYVTAAGSSRDDPRAAELEARAEVTRQVRSSIRVTSEDELSCRTAGGRAEDASRFVQRAVQSASFDFGELIRAVPGLGARGGGAWWAFVALSRGEAVGALEPEFEKDATTFHERSRAALAAKDDLLRFTAEFAEAQRAFDRALPRGLVLRSLAGEYEPVRTLFAGEAALVAAAAAIRSSVVVAIEVANAPDPAGLATGLARWIEAAGLRAEGAALGGNGLALRVSAVEECASRLDVCCSWRLSASLCLRPGATCVPVTLPEATGCDRTDEAGARRDLLSSFGTGTGGTDGMRAALASMVPMPGP